MIKAYVKCPYCKDEIAVSGLKMHCKSKHPEKTEDFLKQFDTLKQTAVKRDTAEKKPVKDEPPKVEDVITVPEKIPEKIPEKKHQEPEKKEGDVAPTKGGSFLDSILDSLDDLW